MVYPTEHTEPERAAHPASLHALVWLQSIPREKLGAYSQKLACLSDSPQHSQTALACIRTISQLLRDEIVDEIDIIALAWIILQIQKGRDF